MNVVERFQAWQQTQDESEDTLEEFLSSLSKDELLIIINYLVTKQ